MKCFKDLLSADEEEKTRENEVTLELQEEL